MPSFSPRSKEKLLTCHPDLQRLFNRVIEHRDCTVVSGHRGEEEQNELYRNGYSMKKFPFSRHNSTPSEAVDVMPYSSTEPHIDWEDTKSLYNFCGFVQGIACELGIKLRSGSDWDMDWDFKDQFFNDLAHFELVLDV